jgi:glycosyltransferase involved in cell wall biosynthesis
MAASVTVIVPCYNYGRFLEDCVRSALDEHDVAVQVLVIDDASWDETPDVAQRLAAEDARVTYVRHAENKGHIATYNEGIDLATGDYTVLVSADDLLSRGALRRAAEIMDADPGIALVYGSARFFTGPAPAQPPADIPYSRSTIDGHEWFARVCRVGENFIVAPEVVVRTDLLHKFGGYDDDLPHSADLEMWLRLALHGSVVKIDVEQAFSRRHGDSMRHSLFADPLLSLRQREAAFAVALKRLDRAADRAPLQSAVNRALARDALWAVAQMAYRRQFDRRRASALVSYAVEKAGPQGSSRVARIVALGPPFVDGLGRWPRGWIKARRRGYSRSLR